jgi:hypothetical protein
MIRHPLCYKGDGRLPLGTASYQSRLFRSGSQAIHRRRWDSGVSGASVIRAASATTAGRFSAQTNVRNELGSNR